MSYASEIAEALGNHRAAEVLRWAERWLAPAGIISNRSLERQLECADQRIALLERELARRVSMHLAGGLTLAERRAAEAALARPQDVGVRDVRSPLL